MKRILSALLILIASASYANAANEMIAVSADIVEISGSIQKTRGFQWNTFFDFTESAVKGIVKLGDFERSTNLKASLKLLETESKAQILANPKVITKNGQQASITVGGEVPVPYANSSGIGAEFKKYGVVLNVLPFVEVESNRRGYVDIQIGLEISNPDYSRTVIASGTTIPTMVTRQLQTEVSIKSGETIVIGGLKRSNYNIAKNRIPILGSLPLIGKLFSSTDIVEEQSSLFLFVTFDIIK
ncbi:MAG: type II and III secretion system protein [Elusimicrobiales bacterium]|nr:type II and III secretion system protein [Elusimicrobiales bacterium]